MSDFKISWRISPIVYCDNAKWQSFLRLIDRHGDIADEVAFYIVDDINPTLPPMQDKTWQAECCKSCFEDLRKRGCRVGINVWPTLSLYDVEQRYYPDMPRMVGIDGKIIENLACPTSDQFIKYICEKITIFVQTNPDFIWIDDDCRFTHMSGNYPCFCESCLKGFKGGEYKSIKELAGTLAVKENRELRTEWCSYGADRLAGLCAALRLAVDKVNPDIDMGLMTIGVTHSTFCGDSITKCMKALRSHRGRPGHDLYNDKSLDKIMWKTLEAARQILQYPDTVTSVMWEEDSCPQGHLAKSLRTRQNEISLGLMAGCNGVAFNHISLNGGIDERLSREADELHRLRKRWEKICEFAKDLPLCGMMPYYSWFMTAKADPKYVWLKEGALPEAQNPDCDITLAEKIGPYGVALTADAENSCAALLCGKALTAMTEDELKTVFSGNVYMDASALVALEELGYAKWAGVRASTEALPGNDKLCTMTEHSFNGEFSGYTYRRMFDGSVVKTLVPLSDSVEWLGVRKNINGEGDRCYISKFVNELGGKVIVNGFDAWKYTDTPSNVCQFFKISEWFDSPLLVRWRNPHLVSRVQPYIRTNGKKAAIMLLNASLDTTNHFEIIIKGEMTTAVLLNSDGSETLLASYRENDTLCVEIPEINAWEISHIIAY